ncbi:MarR family winged helix-turn-helix transcriptional regulator [Cytobacillus depressus]|nr:MarR family winged helix-turn-helix transcriptional regulator [Cytobacillus depressus]
MYSKESPFTATEAMVLFEINRIDTCTASYLAKYFHLDKGYISRILNSFENKNIIIRVSSEVDRRIKYLKITSKGEEELRDLANRASLSVQKMIEHLDKKDIKISLKSMEKIEQILGK